MRPMARRLLAVLAASPGRVVRAELILDNMWPDHPPASATKTLQTYVVHLRRVLGSAAIHYWASGYTLDLNEVDLDAVNLDRRVADAEVAMLAKRWRPAAKDLAAARALVRGIPFDEFAVDEFAAPEVARLSELGWRAVELSGERAVQLGNPAAMVGPLEALVMEQPLRESAWARLVEVLIASGRPADAVRAGERARAILQRELHATPGPSLASALASIPRAGAQAAPKPTGPTRARTKHRGTTLLGREDQLRSIGSFLKATDRSSPGLLVVTGEPGIGKTSLLQEVSSGFVASGGIARFGRCDPNLRTAYHPLLEMLGSPDDLPLDQAGLHPHGRAALRGVLDPQRIPLRQVPLSDAGVERAHLLGAFEDALCWLAAGRRVLLVVDDVHWIDDATLDVLAHLLRRRSDAHGEAGVDITIAVGARTEVGPWQRFVAEAIEHNRSLAVPLTGLRTDTVADMVRARLPGVASGDLSADVHASTGGNPLLVNAVLDDLADRGAGSHSNVPYKVSLLMAGRLSRLDPKTVTVLHAAATSGASFTAAGIASVLSRLTADVERELERATAQHLIVREGIDPSEVRFAQDLLRQAIYESIPTDRRTSLHMRFAQNLATRPGHSEATADHWHRAGRPIQAARSLMETAHRERLMHLRGPALRSAARAAELVTGQPDDVALLMEIQTFRSELLLENGDRVEARAVLRSTRQLVERGTLEYVRVERLSAKLDASDARWEDAAKRLRHCLGELTYLGGPGASVNIDTEWCETQIQLAWVRYFNPPVDRRTEAEVDDALDQVGERAVAAQRVELAHVAGAIENGRSRFVSPDRALQLAHRSLLAAREIDDPVLIADKTFSVGFHLLWRRRLDEAEARLGAAAALFTDIGAENRTVTPLVYLGVASRFRGDVAGTRRRTLVALDACDREQSAIYSAACHANLGWCAWREDDVDDQVEPRQQVLPDHVELALRSGDFGVAIAWAGDVNFV